MIALIGLTSDIPVSDLRASTAFYAVVIGRPPDRVGPELSEWILHRRPEIAVRLTEGVAVAADRVGIGFGVSDLADECERLSRDIAAIPATSVTPNVIAQAELRDPDGYRVVLWQNLMPA